MKPRSFAAAAAYAECRASDYVQRATAGHLSQLDQSPRAQAPSHSGASAPLETFAAVIVRHFSPFSSCKAFVTHDQSAKIAMPLEKIIIDLFTLLNAEPNAHRCYIGYGEVAVLIGHPYSQIDWLTVVFGRTRRTFEGKIHPEAAGTIRVAPGDANHLPRVVVCQQRFEVGESVLPKGAHEPLRLLRCCG